MLFVVLALLMRARRAEAARPHHRRCSPSSTRLARIICELFREPDAQLGFLWGGLTMGMLLSMPLMLAGVGFIWHGVARCAASAAAAA